MKRFLLSILFFVGVLSVGFGQTITTAQSGPWNDTNTWTGGVIPTNSNSTEIRLNHNVNIPSGYTAIADEIFVSALFTLTIDSGGTLDLQNSGGADLTLEEDFSIFFTGSNLVVNGIFINNSTTSLGLGTGLSSVSFNSGSIYEHAINGGIIPSTQTTWDVNSTLLISGVTSSIPSGLGQSFGDFVYNCPSHSGNLLLGINSITINGDFRILNTNSPGVLTLAASGGTKNIGGDFLLSGPSRFIGLNSAGTFNFNVLGNFEFNSSGILSLFTISNASSIFNLNLDGDFIVSSGVLQAYAAVGPDVNINFVGGGIDQEYSIINGGLLASQKYDFSISNSSTVIANESIFVGIGDFNLSAGSQLSTSNVNGIKDDGTGTVQTTGATLTYATGSTISYVGTSNQSIDPVNGFPTNCNLIIDKSSGLANLSSDFTLSSGRTLTLIEGTLNIGDGNLLTLNGTVSTTNGGISGGTLSNLSIGGTGTFGTLGFVGSQELNDFTINRTSSGSVTLGGDLTVNGVLTQSNGDLLLNGNTLTISADYDQTGGTLISNATSSLLINGSGTLPASLSFSGDINTITLDRSGATLNTGASGFTATNLNLYSGELQGTGISIADGGTLERRTSGSLANALTAVGSYNLIYDNSSAINSGAELPTSTSALNNIEKRGTGVLTVQNDFTANGSLTFTNGSFDAGANTISLNGDLVANAGSTLSNSTITFGGTTNLTGSNNPTFGSITVNGTFNPAANLTVNGDITNNGTLNSSAGTLTINATSQLNGSNPITVNNFTIGASGNVTASATEALEIDGNFTNNGSFNANDGTVIFGGNTTISGTVPNFASIQVDGIFNAPSTLNLSGSLTNNGTFNDGDGIINMTGGSTRAIAGTSAFNIHTLNLDGSTVSNNNTGGVSIENGITLAANTTFDADGGGAGITTLLSTSSTDAAYIGQIPSTSSVTGNITVQRYFSTGRFWRYLGSPVTNSTVADWQEEFPITGTFDDRSSGTFDGTSLNSTSPSLYYYDAAGSAYVAYPSSGTAASNPIENGRGYSPFIRNSTSNIIGAVTGTLQQQTATLPVADNGDPNESWNLVANPYAAPIDWDAAGWTKTNVANEVHVPLTSGGFATYINGTASNGGSQFIASGQAFWVRTNGSSPSLQTEESVKRVEQNPTYQRTEPLELFRIEMSHADLSDEIVFALRDEATFGFDEDFDANRRLNINGFGYTLSTTGDDGKNLKINSIPKVVDSDCSVSIPVNMESVTKTGDFKLSFSEVSNLLNYYSVDFVDNYENEVITFDSDFQYTYVINSDAGSKAKDRFSLILNNKEIDALTNLSNLDACASSEVSYSFNNLNDTYNYSIYKEDVKLSDILNQTSASIDIPDSLLLDSVNEFEVYGNAGTCDSVKVGTFVVNIVDSNINLDVNVRGSKICPQATQGNFELNTENGVKYSVLFGSDTIQSFDGDGNLFVGAIKSENLSVGNNVFSIYAEKNKCTYGSLNQQLEIFVDALEIDENIEFSASNACLKSSADLSFITQDKIDYEIFKGTTLLHTVNGNGTEQTVAIVEANLGRGINEFTIVAKYGKCAQYEFPEPVQIEVEEDINTNLDLIAENTCGDSNVSVVIENAQTGKIYTLQSSGENIGSLTADSDGQLTFSLNPNQLNIGVNELDIQIEGEICGVKQSSNQAVFTVYEAISPDLEIQSPNVCSGEEVIIEISNPQQGKTYSLLQSENSVATQTAINDGTLIFSLSSDQFQTGINSMNVEIVDDNCGTLTANQTIEFELFETAEISDIENQNVCKGESVTFDFSANVGMSNYQLYVGEELISEASTSIFELSPSETTTYSLTGIPENGCKINTVNFTINVTDLATSGILVSNNVLESSVEGDSYQWYLNDEILEGENGKVLVAQESGDYTVEVAKMNCTKLSDIYTFSEAVLNANKALADAVNLYPNPVEDVLNIDMENIDEIEITIYTISGKFMDKLSLSSAKKQSIDMSKFAKGTYLIQLTSGKGTITKRIIKQ